MSATWEDTMHELNYGRATAVGRGYIDNTLVPAAGVCVEFGVCRRTLARWAADAALMFPSPTVIRGRWFFRRGAIEAWKTEQAKISAARTR
jgi:hypothetical protein